MENRSHALAAGAFVLLVSALLAGLALWLTRDRASYQRFELSSRESVSGLQPQAAVRYKGVAVGKVQSIGFDPRQPGNVLIRIAVNTDAPISATTFATLGYQGVTGLAHVLLDDASGPLPAPVPGASGLPQLPLRPSPLSQIAEQGPLIVAQVQEAMQSINQLLNGENRVRFGVALERLASSAHSADQLIQRLDQTLAAHVDPALASLPALTAQAQQTLAALREGGVSAQQAAQEMGLAVRQLRAEGGAIDGMAQSTRALAQAAERFSRITLPRVNQASDATARAARGLSRTLSGINDNPQQLLYGPTGVGPGPGEPGFAAPAATPLTDTP